MSTAEMNTAMRVPTKANSRIDPMFLKKGLRFMLRAPSNKIGGSSTIMNNCSKPFLMVLESLVAPKILRSRPEGKQSSNTKQDSEKSAHTGVLDVSFHPGVFLLQELQLTFQVVVQRHHQQHADDRDAHIFGVLGSL